MTIYGSNTPLSLFSFSKFMITVNFFVFSSPYFSFFSPFRNKLLSSVFISIFSIFLHRKLFSFFYPFYRFHVTFQSIFSLLLKRKKERKRKKLSVHFFSSLSSHTPLLTSNRSSIKCISFFWSPTRRRLVSKDAHHEITKRTLT